MITTFHDIKTFDDVLEYLGLDEDDFYESFNPEIISKEFVIWNLIMKAFIKISNDESQLSSGPVCYPYCYIIWEDEALRSDRIDRVRNCIINNRNAFLIGNVSTYSSYSGFGSSNPNFAVAPSSTNIGYRAFSSREVAKHVVKYFAKELIDFSIGWRNDEIQWL